MVAPLLTAHTFANSALAGFGLGALNDADDDDVDIYDAGAGSGRSRLAFDDSLGDDDQYISIGSSSRRQPAPREPVSLRSFPYALAPLTCFDKRVPPGISQTFHDGTPVLRGFVLSGKPVAEDRWYVDVVHMRYLLVTTIRRFSLPKIPPGWKPDPRRVWEQEKNKENRPASADQIKTENQLPSSHAAWKRSQLSADEVSCLPHLTLPSKLTDDWRFLERHYARRDTFTGEDAFRLRLHVSERP